MHYYYSTMNTLLQIIGDWPKETVYDLRFHWPNIDIFLIPLIFTYVQLHFTCKFAIVNKTTK